MFYIYWFVHTYWFLHVSIHVCSWSSLTKYIENAAAPFWSWSKWGDRGGVVIWWKICWHVFLRSHIWEFFVWISRNSSLSERKRHGGEEVWWTCVDNISPANHINCISLVLHCGAGPRTPVTLIISQLKWLPRLTWGEKCLVQILYYEMGNPFRRANLLYRLLHSFSLRRRGSNIRFWPSSAQNSLPERT